ncbi:MAG: glycosyltransferase [Candidatus Margulisbacteria bacterium]|nr:glycosyltransferase [Candidatus Margulisiibacteriota bacterium]
MKISVVIGTYNQKDNLKFVLESFFRQSLYPTEYEIIVVDSFSTDGTDSMIEQLSPPCRLNYLRRENRGKAAARNFGVNEAKAAVILLTDADMIADPNLLKEHLETHTQYKNISVEGVTFNLKNKISIPELSSSHPNVEAYIKQKLKNGQKLKWSYFLSGNLSLCKEDFLKAGSFDENFSGYGWEDIELGYRLFKMKVPLIYNPLAINYHYHFVTNEDMLQRKYNMGKSAAYFYQKHPNFEIKMFLGMNPIAMGVFKFLNNQPNLRKKISSQYIQEEYQYRLGLSEGLRS